VTINRDFEGMLMGADVMGAYSSLVQAGFPPRAVLKALQAGGRVPEDEDVDALELEWLASRIAEERFAETERADRAQDVLEDAAR